MFRPVRLVRPEDSKALQQHALKGQKLLAQGNALGIMSVSNAPCKGKSFKIHRIKMETPLRYVKLLPLQGARFATHKKPRALPWAKSFCPFRACCLYEPSGRAAYMSLLGVLLIWASWPLWRAAYMGFWPSERAAYMSFLALLGRVEYTCETYLTMILYVLPSCFTMFRPFCRPWVRRPLAS